MVDSRAAVQHLEYPVLLRLGHADAMVADVQADPPVFPMAEYFNRSPLLSSVMNRIPYQVLQGHGQEASRQMHARKRSDHNDVFLPAQLAIQFLKHFLDNAPDVQVFPRDLPALHPDQGQEVVDHEQEPPAVPLDDG